MALNDDEKKRAARTKAKIIKNVDKGRAAGHKFDADDWRIIVQALSAVSEVNSIDYSHYRKALTGRYRGCNASEAMVKFDSEIRDTTSDLYRAILFFADFIKMKGRA